MRDFAYLAVYTEQFYCQISVTLWGNKATHDPIEIP